MHLAHGLSFQVNTKYTSRQGRRGIMATTKQWACKLLAAIGQRPAAKFEIAEECIRMAVNEALREAAYRLSLSNAIYSKQYGADQPLPKDDVLDLKRPEPNFGEVSALEGLFFEEPQFSEDGLIALYSRDFRIYRKNYEVVLNEYRPDSQTIMLNDGDLIDFFNLCNMDEGLLFKEPKFSQHNSVAIYPRNVGLHRKNYEVVFRSGEPDSQTIMLDDRGLIELCNMYSSVRANRRGGCYP